jgi:hypothetical protein
MHRKKVRETTSRGSTLRPALAAALLLPALGAGCGLEGMDAAGAGQPLDEVVQSEHGLSDPPEVNAPGEAEGASEGTQDERVAAVLANNPGARAVGPGKVELSDGIFLNVPVQPFDVQGCPTQSLCLSQHANFAGDQLQFIRCRDVNLGNLRMRDGRPWNDKVSSIRNAQVGNDAQARFYNYDGTGNPDSPSNWRFVIAVNINRYLRDLSRDSSADGGSANDKIDIVHVCNQ